MVEGLPNICKYLKFIENSGTDKTVKLLVKN